MLPKSQRIGSSETIARIMKNGRYIDDGPIGVRVLVDGDSSATIAVVVGKKLLSRAVDRHTAKRRLGEAIRSVYKSLLPGTLAVFFYRTKTPLTLSQSELQQSVEAIAKKLSVKR